MTRQRKTIVCITAVLVVCGIGFGGYSYWYLLKPWHEFQNEDQGVAEIFKRIGSEPPPGVVEREWKEFLGMVYTAYGNVTFSPFYQRESFDTLAGMRRFRCDLDQHLAATDTVNVDTLRWIFYRLAKFGPKGKAYIEQRTTDFEHHADFIERRVLKEPIDKFDEHTLIQPHIQESIMTQDSHKDSVPGTVSSEDNESGSPGSESEFLVGQSESAISSTSNIRGGDSGYVVSEEIVDDLLISSVQKPPLGTDLNRSTSREARVLSQATTDDSMVPQVKVESVGPVRRQPPTIVNPAESTKVDIQNRINLLRETTINQRAQRLARMEEVSKNRRPSRRKKPSGFENLPSGR
tara:strand:+ start:15352 stop:16398 length:1047 start_codon:yes stop_codon:yes gene_type:complete